MKKRVLLYIVLFLTFLCISICFGYMVISEANIAFLVPGCIGLVGAICFLYLLYREAFCGRKTYYYDAGKMYVQQKGKSVETIDKINVEKVVLIYDLFQEDLHMISFRCNSKKYYFRIDPTNKEVMLSLIEGKNYRKKKNHWYYLIEWLTT